MAKENTQDDLALIGEPPPRSKGRMGGFTSASPGALPPKPDLSLANHPLDVQRTVFSEDRTHRFTWFRAFPGRNPDDFVAGIGMNPSRADEVYPDSTVRKMCVWAKDHWGAGGYYQLNALSLRLTASTALKDYPCVNLPENDAWIRRIVSKARFVVVSWGNPGHQHGRGAEVEAILREACDPSKVLCFGKNLNGSPVHPLYQAYETPLVPYFS
jgi:hypothetical protein